MSDGVCVFGCLVGLFAFLVGIVVDLVIFVVGDSDGTVVGRNNGDIVGAKVVGDCDGALVDITCPAHVPYAGNAPMRISRGVAIFGFHFIQVNGQPANA